jgi:hypothetical protein
MCIPTNTTSPTVSIIKKSAATNSSNTMKANNEMLVKRRRLTFAPVISKVIGTVLSRRDYTVQEKLNCWWSLSEVSKSRTHSLILVTTALEHGQHFIKMIDDSFKWAQYLSTNLGDKKVHALLQDPSSYSYIFDTWTFTVKGSRGLEKHMSYFQKTAGRRIRRMVIRTQRMGVSSEDVADLYAEKCLASRIHARWMGEIDFILAYVL